MTSLRLTMLLLVVALGACAKKDKEVVLADIRNTGNGPEEFAIIPGKPLQAPETFTTLPAPTPGGPNLTDQDPRGDSVIALGGNPAAIVTGGVPATDGGLISHATRFGRDPNIRQTLAREDKDVRRQFGRRNIIPFIKASNYVNAYERQWLDSAAEVQRLRRAGVKTPSAAPSR